MFCVCALLQIRRPEDFIIFGGYDQRMFFAVNMVGYTHVAWQQEWNDSTKGQITKSFFTDIGERESNTLQTGLRLSTIVTGDDTLRAY